MKVNRRTQRERTASTREALLDAARMLFARHGYGKVSMEAVVREAGLSRGALYHQFGSKRDLFEAVLEAVEEETLQRIALLLADVVDPREAFTVGIDAWLEACGEPAVQQIVLIDAPAVLGWQEWRAVGLRYGLGVVEAALAGAVDAGQLRPQPLRPLAHLLVGALDEAALYVARAEEPVNARAEMQAALRDLVNGLLRPLA